MYARCDVETAAYGYLVERRLDERSWIIVACTTLTLWLTILPIPLRAASLRRTAEGGCPQSGSCRVLHERDARAYIRLFLERSQSSTTKVLIEKPIQKAQPKNCWG
jgi:hypothetical protein